MRDLLLKKLFRGVDPFKTWRNHSGKKADHSYPHSGLSPDLVRQTIKRILDRNITVPLIVEVGSFKGGSACTIASTIKEAGLHATLLCIDTFLGDVNMRTDHNGWLDWLDLQGGHPTVFDQFMANIVDRGHQDVVLPLVASSTVGLRALQRIGITFPMAYLDSAHEAEETMLELKLLSRLMPGGSVLLGDDFSWPSVSGDVVTFVQQRKLNMNILDGHYYSIDMKGE